MHTHSTLTLPNCIPVASFLVEHEQPAGNTMNKTTSKKPQAQTKRKHTTKQVTRGELKLKNKNTKRGN